MATKHHKKILLGITGGIAAYKSAELARLLIAQGHEVRVVMTASAREFITPLTMQALTGNPVHDELLDAEAEMGMGHIELAKWADEVLIAPASANFIARLNAGFADDLLTTICLATKAFIYLAPAMNEKMWENPTTQKNLNELTSRLSGALKVLGPASGVQACGDVGFGRMLEPADIVAQTQTNEPLQLAGLRVLISAGPTREPIDPVRYISNRSSGKMGYSLAEQACKLGAQVTLVSGPVSICAPNNVELTEVETAEQMHKAVMSEAEQADIFISVAAVADYALKEVAKEKIKKQSDNLALELIKNKDIVSEVAHRDKRPFVVGFAAETQDMEKHAKDKLARKNLDMLVGNLVSDTGLGFNADDNSATLFWHDGQKHYPSMLKTDLAHALLLDIHEHYQQNSDNNLKK